MAVAESRGAERRESCDYDGDRALGRWGQSGRGHHQRRRSSFTLSHCHCHPVTQRHRHTDILPHCDLISVDILDLSRVKTGETD